MRDIRTQPFCWQSSAAMAALRRKYTGKERTTAVAIYQSMTEVANERRDSRFRAFRKELAERAGTSVRTLDRYAQEFAEIGLLDKETVEIGARNEANWWTLLDVAQPDAPPPRSQEHQGVAQPDAHKRQQQTLVPNDGTVERDDQQEDARASDLPQDLWHQFEIVVGGKVTEHLTDVPPSMRRVAEKALAEYDFPALVTALHGFVAWRQKKPGDRRFSSIFGTHPGSRPLHDHIAFWIDQAGEASGLHSFPSEARVKITRAVRDVQRAFGSRDPDTLATGEEALTYLKSLGIDAVPDGDGRPTFPSLAGGS